MKTAGLYNAHSALAMGLRSPLTSQSQIEALGVEDTDPATLVVLDNRIAGACIRLYVLPEDNI